jgi:hypothetical protein
MGREYTNAVNMENRRENLDREGRNFLQGNGTGVQPFMKKYRPILTALIALLFYAGTDILIWQRVFEANHMVEYAGTYHTGWFMSLAGYATIGLLLMWGAWKDCLYFLTSLFVGAFSGLEDLLYYILDRKPIPESLPWLANNPMIHHSSRAGLIESALFWLIALAAFYVLLYHRKNDLSRSLS